MSTLESPPLGPGDDPPSPVALVAPPLPFPVVGLGASAGGIKALQSFFEQMPSGAGMAFVVVLHLSRSHESSLAEVLQNATRMRVAQVTGSVKIERDRVYVIPPNKQLSMRDGHLEITDFVHAEGRASAVDLFFRTLAAAHRQHAVAIVLSGTGADGAVGLKSIKEHGGVTLAQLPTDAEHDSMPRSALGTGVVDFVLPVSDMPERLMALWQNMQHINVPGMSGAAAAAVDPDALEDALAAVLALLRARTGHDFSQYKRATLLRRLERRLQVNQVRDLPSYREFLERHPAETRALLKDLLISVTNFFRDREVFERLAQDVVPKLMSMKAMHEQVRVWVPACATGEEAYSMAMLLVEGGERLGASPAIQVFATDIDEDALHFARLGLYPESIATDVQERRLRRFFVREQGGYRVHSALRERVMFAPHNLLKDPPFSRIDLVSCRNLLIYLNRDMQARVLDTFSFALQPHGFLVLGSSESVDDRSDAFALADKTHRIFTSLPGKRPVSVNTSGPVLMPAVAGPTLAGRIALPRGGGVELHQRLLEHYAPPSVLVNDQHEVLHLSENAGHFLQFNAGEPSLNLLRIVPAELRADLRASLYQAFQTMQDVSVRIGLHKDAHPVDLLVHVHPAREATSGRIYALVMFDEHPAAQLAPPRETPPANATLVERLEQELNGLRGQLRSTVEQYETQTEELRASNEELQAVNEELRSATEELETSKEELQSMNEELTTVNQELKNKVDEAVAVNNDVQNFIASTDIAVLFIDRGKFVMRFTPRAGELFNLIPGDIGRSLLDMNHRLHYPELAEDVDAVFHSLALREREVRGVNGRCYLARVVPYRTTEDRIEGAVLTFVDISARVSAEEQLRRNAEWMRFVMDSARDYAIFTTNLDGIIETWSSGAAAQFGWSAEEVVGRSCDIVFTPEDREAGRPADERRRAREEGRAEDERWHMRRDGSRFWCSGIMAPVRDGELYGYVKIARDLTERQQAELERQQALAREQEARQQLERTNQQKDDFLATLSHELRNPLNLILMQSQLLLRSDSLQDEKSRHIAEIIYQTTATQARLVDDLLDVSRTLTGKLAMQKQLLPLPFIVGDSIGGLVHEAEQKAVTLDVNLTPEALIVQADPARLRQIAWNLITNAIKFTASGGKVTIRLAREGNSARLDVIDTGQGIPAEQVAQVFDLYQQNRSVLTRAAGGMGIGLALVKQLVEAHRGRVEAHSEGTGKGARFSVWLPVYEPGNLGELEPGPVVQGRVVQAPVEPDAVASEARLLAGLTILLVDDGQDALEAMTELLEMEGARVHATTRPEEALELSRRHTFSVIISDLAMPGMDGLALLREIRGTTRNARTPAIVSTGFNRSQDVARATAAGFDAYVSKPVSIPDLVQVIVTVVKDSRTKSL